MSAATIWSQPLSGSPTTRASDTVSRGSQRGKLDGGGATSSPAVDAVAGPVPPGCSQRPCRAATPVCSPPSAAHDVPGPCTRIFAHSPASASKSAAITRQVHVGQRQ